MSKEGCINLWRKPGSA